MNAPYPGPLHPGMDTELVAVVKDVMHRKHGAPLLTGRRYGRRLKIAVYRAQRRHGLTHTGVVNKQTWDRLIAPHLDQHGRDVAATLRRWRERNIADAPRYPGRISRGMRFAAVTAVKRALASEGFDTRIQVKNPVFSPRTALQLKRFQVSRGVPATGIVDRATWPWLAVELDKEGRRQVQVLRRNRLRRRRRRTSRDRAVDVMRNHAIRMIRNNQYIHYTMGGSRWQGIASKIKPPAFPVWADCSSAVTYLYWVAGAPDPNGKDYVWGYTGTLTQHGEVIPIADARPGDLIFYGAAWPYEHVVMVIHGRGWSSTVFSHGSEPGPYALHPGYRGDASHARRYPLT